MQPNIFQVILPLFIIIILLAALWRIGLRKLKTYRSPILGKIEVSQKFNGEKILTTNDYIQGISIGREDVKHSYWYAVAKEAADFCKKTKNPEVLMLGLGANTIPNLIAEINPSIHQTIVEIDGVIIEACRKFFKLDDLPNSNLIKADAFKLFSEKDAFDKKLNVIIVDIFLGAPPYVSIDSNQPGFIVKLLPYLKSDGMIIFNRPGHTGQVRSESEVLQNYLSSLFKKTATYDIKDPRGFRNTIITSQERRQKPSGGQKLK